MSAAQAYQRDGWVVINGPPAMTAAEVQEYFCDNKAATKLPGEWGRWRHQVNGTREARQLGRAMTASMNQAGLLNGRLELMDTPLGLYGIRTEPGAPQQGLPHTDWERQTFERFELEDMPFSAIWAAAARFELHGPAGEVIPVRKGQMAVFRGNWGHCGGRHCSSQLRVHAFGRRIGSNLIAPLNVFGYQ